MGEPGTDGRRPVVRVSTAVSPGRVAGALTAARDAAATVPVVRTGPTGITAFEPLVLVTAGGRTAYFGDPDPSTVRSVVSVTEGGELPTDGADSVVEHDPEPSSLPVPSDGPLSVGRRHVLGPCGWVDPYDPSDHDIVSSVQDAGDVTDTGLLGRGRGDAAEDDPVADEWKQARETDGDPVVVVNAHDADSRTRSDRTLLAGAPFAVLDGVAAVAEYVGAEDVAVYVNEAETELQEHLRRAIDAVGDELPIDPQLVAGPDEYRAGGPTAALEAMEGADRIEPRIQPPSPAKHGLYGRPTVVHTPRTFAQVQYALRRPDAFDPDAADPGTRLVTVTGDVAAPATIELGSGGSLESVRDAVRLDGSFKMACVGGVLGGITGDLAIAPTAQSLADAGLGTDGVVELLSDDRCVVATAGERARFAAAENSGRCVPGREGTQQLTELLRDVYQGSLESTKIRELGRVMRRSSNCKTGANAPRPVMTAMDEFEPEFKAHANGRCPSGTCTEKL
jgi:NADH-quinone oxidoreductase subunit F